MLLLGYRFIIDDLEKNPSEVSASVRARGTTLGASRASTLPSSLSPTASTYSCDVRGLSGHRCLHNVHDQRGCRNCSVEAAEEIAAAIVGTVGS